MRPDLLPMKIEGIDLKKDWFNFFKMISYDKAKLEIIRSVEGYIKVIIIWNIMR